ALQRVRDVTLTAYANQDLPYEMLTEALRAEHGAGAGPLFQVMFVLQNNPLPPVELEGLEASFITVGIEAEWCDLILYMSESNSGLVGHLQYDRDLFEASTINLMVDRLTTLLQNVADNPDEYITSISTTSAEELKALTASFNVAL